MRPVVLDFETFFGDDYTLSKMTTEEYIRDPRFEAHGAAIKWSPNDRAIWYDGRDLRWQLQQEDWSDVFLICHHAQFDGLILSHHYGVVPKMYGCTLSMGRLLLGNHLSVGLDPMRAHFGMHAKKTPYHLFRGKRWREMSREVQEEIGDGACDEVESIWELFTKHLAPQFPVEEYGVVDMLVRMFTQPVLGMNIPLLRQLWTDEETRKSNRLQRIAQVVIDANAARGIDVTPSMTHDKWREFTERQLQSADQFAELLRFVGEEPETKITAKGNENYAFAKTDPYMRDYLLEHENDDARSLAEARLGVKSTILQTRAENFGRMAERGAVPVYLRYCGASTLRPSGGDGANWLNLKRRSTLRKSVRAPDGYWLAPVDASQIECVAEDELVLTNNGPKAIQHVLLTDLVWDGIEWVAHEGVVCKGTKSVISYQGLTATPEHIVYVEGPSGEEKMEMRAAAASSRRLVTTSSSTPIRQAPLRQSFVRRLQNLWSARHSVQIQNGSRSGDLGRGESTAQGLSWRGDRSQKQRWSLRAWQSKIIDATRQRQQSLYDVLGTNFAWAYGHAGFQTPLSSLRLQSRRDQRFSRERFDGRTNTPSVQNEFQENDMAKSTQARNGARSGFEAAQTQVKKVYDIVNAGPRHRFTVSGVLVSNCRVLHYLAGGADDPVIKLFRAKEDPYAGLASRFYGEPIYKPKDGDPRKDEMEAKRGMGKQGRLMCGYGSSGKMFRQTAKNGLYGPPLDIPIDTAEEFVRVYREDNPSICARGYGYWAQCSRMLARLAGGEPVDWGPLRVENHRILVGPGRLPMIYDTLEYYKPHPDEAHEYRETEQNGFWRLKTKNGWKTMWGSKLTQNICEAVSRVIVSHAMMRIWHRYQIRTLNWPYDELLLLIPKTSDADQLLEACLAEMRQTPEWLPGLPLDAEGALGDQYDK